MKGSLKVVKAGHNNNTTFLGNTQRSGFSAEFETLCLKISMNVSLGASWKELCHEINSDILATKM